MAVVYRSYDQAELDAQYNNRTAVPDHPRWTEHWPDVSAKARAVLGGKLDIAYGGAPRQVLDIFPAAKPGAPVLVYIHGGFWRIGDKSIYSFVAAPFVKQGITVVVISYPLAPAATLDAIGESVRLAMAWAFRNAASFGGDPTRLHVAGHSAGGHLVAMVLSTDWTERGLPAELVKGGCAISGVYDLEPIRLCYLNQELHLDAAMAARNSPLELVPAAAPPLILAVGGDETDEFLRQQEVYAEAWHGAGLPLAIAPMPGKHHFSILDGFVDPASPLFKALNEQIFGSK